jgi:hypothetical protein
MKVELDQAVLHAFIAARPLARFRTNFGIHKGSSLADFAVIDEELILIETKSDLDRTTRLPSQEMHYSNVGDRCVLATGPVLFEKASKMVPEWWGLVRAREEDGFVFLKEVRAPQPNPSINPVWLAKLLWKNELQDLLKRRRPKGMAGLTRAPAHALAVEATKCLSLNALRIEVRVLLGLRGGDACFVRALRGAA